MKNEKSESDKDTAIDWHSGFAGGLSLSFRKYKDDITIEREHQLSKKPLRIDFLVIKKNSDTRIDNAIGEYFRQYNIIEYKNPQDALTIDVVWKTIGYAGIYKSLGSTMDEISAKELTITIIRHSLPRELLRQFENDGYNIVITSPGVYMICGIIDIPLQIVVIRELTDSSFRALKVMTSNADAEEVRSFLLEAKDFETPADRNDADAVLQVSARANRDLYNLLKGDSAMCEALREIMAQELKEAEEKGGNLKEKELTPIIIDLRKANAEKDTALAEKDTALAEKDSALARKDARIIELEAELAKLKG